MALVHGDTTTTLQRYILTKKPQVREAGLRQRYLPIPEEMNRNQQVPCDIILPLALEANLKRENINNLIVHVTGIN